MGRLLLPAVGASMTPLSLLDLAQAALFLAGMVAGWTCRWIYAEGKK